MELGGFGEKNFPSAHDKAGDAQNRYRADRGRPYIDWERTRSEPYRGLEVWAAGSGMTYWFPTKDGRETRVDIWPGGLFYSGGHTITSYTPSP